MLLPAPTKDKPGLFEAAGKGTIFLDEIGDTSSAFQVRLLRVLEEKAFQPLGSVQKVKTDIRIVTATNRDLGEMVEKGEFRRDLFYRINIIRFQLPPLRERKEDIPLLIERFIKKMNHIKGRSVAKISKEAMSLLLAHDYPGNIRELENIIEHSFVLCSDAEIEMSHLPAYLIEQKNSQSAVRLSMEESVGLSEKETIVTALKQNDYNRLATASELGIHKSTLFRKLKKHHITLPEIDGRTGRKSLLKSR